MQNIFWTLEAIHFNPEKHLLNGLAILSKIFSAHCDIPSFCVSKVKPISNFYSFYMLLKIMYFLIIFQWSDIHLLFSYFSFSLDLDIIKEKIRKLKERARIDSIFASFLNRESDDIKHDHVTMKNIGMCRQIIF